MVQHRRRQRPLNSVWQLLLTAFRSAYEQRHPNRPRPYIEATLGIAAFWAGLTTLEFVFGVVAPSSPYLLLTLLIALRWGLRLGLFAAVLSVIAEELPPPPLTVTAWPVPHALANLVIYATVALAVGLLASFYRGERLRAEKAAQQERDAAEYQRRMVAILAHDLKAPLTAVRGYMELGQRQIRQGQPQRAEAALAISLEQLERLTGMITSLVEASRIEQAALVLEVVPLAAALERATRAFASDPTHPLELHVASPETLAVRADPSALARIMDNLLSNAVKYSPNGGAISVEATRLGPNTPAGRVRIRVQDRGIGVPPEERAKIFAPYYRGTNQRFASGTGVGLYICRELAQKMGGALTYAPNPGGGSSFQLELAAAAPSITAGPRRAPATVTADAALTMAGNSQSGSRPTRP